MKPCGVRKSAFFPQAVVAGEFLIPVFSPET